MDNKIYVETMGISNVYLPVQLSKDKGVFHYLSEKLGSDFPKFNLPDDGLYFLGDTANGEIKEGLKAGVIFSLNMFNHKDFGDICHGFQPETYYVLSEEVGKEFIDNEKIVFDDGKSLNKLLNNCRESIEIIGYRKNKEGTYTRPPAECKVILDYYFREGILFGIDAVRSTPDRRMKYANTPGEYTDIFESIIKDYKGIIFPDNLFKRKEWKEKRKQIGAYEMLLLNKQIPEKDVVDEIVDNLHPILINEYKQACKASENKG